MSDLDPLRRLQPDHIEPDDPADPAVFARAKEQLMSTIDETHADVWRDTPDVYPRLAYRDELAAVEYLSRVFGFVEQREARLEFDGKYLCWLRLGTGMVMVTHPNEDVHRIHSPLDAGVTTVIFHVYVHDVDAHYANAVNQGATITMDLRRRVLRRPGVRGRPTRRATAGTSASGSTTSAPAAAPSRSPSDAVSSRRSP